MGIIDRREITFDRPAIMAALVDVVDGATALGLPRAKPDIVRLIPSQQRITLLWTVGDGTADFDIPAETLGALLIAHCHRRQVVLPRRAAKSVSVEADAVVLSFTVHIAAGDALVAERLKRGRSCK
ncbi:hypothetical protein JMJ56_22250 [Belnapia sp. T18]|uniref:Uncharacterized protein n=1 Tax=Belnapia arida TaxID=2804533 RepID=A0ABS1U7U4_9PROT|nr:hypothetical protein [Belnapia arida]MBL6080742.1 hypothetical protein [Belnapia arida]